MPKTRAFAVTDCFRLDGGDRTAVCASFEKGVPALIYFGRPLPDNEDITALAYATIPNVSSGQLDTFLPLTLCPLAITGWPGHPGLIVQAKNGCVELVNLKLISAERQGEFGLCFRHCDRGQCEGLRLTVFLRLEPETGILCLRQIAHIPEDMWVSWLAAPSVPVPTNANRIIDHSGRWCGEFRRQENMWHTGIYMRESREGRNGHAHFPAVLFATPLTGATSGVCLGATLAWTGGHRMFAEEIVDGRRTVQFAACTDSRIQGVATSPMLLVAWSDMGFNGIAQALHGHVRTQHTPTQRKSKPRPLHYNCWEAVYFRHNLSELKTIATLAARLGAERFVLDDGWFRGRNDETSSLGDWDLDRQKFPEGLDPLIDHVHKKGMRFGLWFEPEMVSRDSDLYRAHSDYVLATADQPTGRQQYVLDMANPEVRRRLFTQIDAILSKHSIDYVKWDHNRPVIGGSLAHTDGFMILLRDIITAHPGVDFESCASGGGRLDFSVLEMANRVWLSDSNDALERLRIQHEAICWIPPEFQGAHVGPRRCYTSSRILSMSFRAWVAAQRHMGIEMDPRELTSEEAATLTRVINWWKENREFLFSGRNFRLETEDEEVFAEMVVDASADRFILFCGQAGASRQISARPLCAAGLDRRAIYALTLVNREDIDATVNRFLVNPLALGNSARFSGTFLMDHGIALPNSVPASMLVIEGRRVLGDSSPVESA